MGDVTLSGDSPYHLYMAQRGSASANGNNGVTGTIYCIKDGKELVPVSFQLSAREARELAAALLTAAAASEKALP